MTNEMIILAQQVQLQKEGVLKFTGRMIPVQTPDGELKEIPEIQPIHTYATWKALGYQVRKGEKAVAKFPVWKFVVSSKKDEDINSEQSGHMIMKVSAFFTDEQVEKIREVEHA